MDEDYDDYDEYNDAADDWEAEAAEEEAREKEILEQKALIEEQKIQKRVKAPARVKKEEEDEETLASDIAQALIEMKEMANSVDEARRLMGTKDDSDEKRIADMPANTAEEAAALGEAIAARVGQFALSPHFNAMIGVIFQDLAQEFQSRTVMNTEASKVHVASEEMKRRLKKAKRKKGAHNNDATTATAAAAGQEEEEEAEEKGAHDALGFDAVTDKGGAACIMEGEDDFM
ncbi:hypothetical protein DQ04_01121040 [Trypanosoma grayi]|uniref:hypothetical protein n=1 Tax=Trypanosoma grayi TaxID=71804 RepID=UPI0004F45B76|nr:hypothetical protein DQ04_01121040 [Trypanosoma grayi]KEG13249.1 hypothetical protein DQ04_01121040 [Trypanosoma grayi]